MNVMIDLCVVPIGVGVSVAPQVTTCQRVIRDSGLKHAMHAYGTNIEGPWDEVMAVVKHCHEAVHDMGAPRIFTTMKVGTRIDKEQSMDDKTRSVERLLSE